MQIQRKWKCSSGPKNRTARFQKGPFNSTLSILHPRLIFLSIEQWPGGSHVSDQGCPTHAFNPFFQQETRHVCVTASLEFLLQKEETKKTKANEERQASPKLIGILRWRAGYGGGEGWAVQQLALRLSITLRTRRMAGWDELVKLSRTVSAADNQLWEGSIRRSEGDYLKMFKLLLLCNIFVTGLILVWPHFKSREAEYTDWSWQAHQSVFRYGSGIDDAKTRIRICANILHNKSRTNTI